LCKVDLIEDIDSEDFIFKNLSDLSLVHVNPTLSVPLIKKNSKTLTKLELGNSFYKNELDYFKDIKFSKLRYLKIQRMYETDALTLIQNTIDTLEELYICDDLFVCMLFENLKSVPRFKFPHVKRIHFEIDFKYLLSSKLVLSLIDASNENTNILLNNERICKELLKYLHNEIRYSQMVL